MPTKKTPKTVAIWRLRVPVEMVRKVQELAEVEQRSVTKQAAVLLQEALQHRQK
jgi:hypothetical protein